MAYLYLKAKLSFVIFLFGTSPSRSFRGRRNSNGIFSPNNLWDSPYVDNDAVSLCDCEMSNGYEPGWGLEVLPYFRKKMGNSETRRTGEEDGSM